MDCSGWAQFASVCRLGVMRIISEYVAVCRIGLKKLVTLMVSRIGILIKIRFIEVRFILVCRKDLGHSVLVCLGLSHWLVMCRIRLKSSDPYCRLGSKRSVSLRHVMVRRIGL